MSKGFEEVILQTPLLFLQLALRRLFDGSSVGDLWIKNYSTTRVPYTSLGTSLERNC